MKEIVRGFWLVVVAAIAAAGVFCGCEDESTTINEPDNVTVETNAAPRIDVRVDGTNNTVRVDLRDDEPASTNAPAATDGDTIRIDVGGQDNRLDLRALEEHRRQRAEIEARGI